MFLVKMSEKEGVLRVFCMWEKRLHTVSAAAQARSDPETTAPMGHSLELQHRGLNTSCITISKCLCKKNENGA